MKFRAYGHPNIRGTHQTTIEFTKDSELSLNGDCILGVNADFNPKKFTDFAGDTHHNKIRITITADSISDELAAELNPLFSDNHELVIRKSDFLSKRTFAINATKACCDLNRKLVEILKKPYTKVSIKIGPIHS